MGELLGNDSCEPMFLALGEGLNIGTKIEIADPELRAMAFWKTFLETKCRSDAERTEVLGAVSALMLLDTPASRRVMGWVSEQFKIKMQPRVKLPTSEVGERTRKMAQNAPVVVDAVATKRIPDPNLGDGFVPFGAGRGT